MRRRPVRPPPPGDGQDVRERAEPDCRRREVDDEQRDAERSVDLAQVAAPSLGRYHGEQRQHRPGVQPRPTRSRRKHRERRRNRERGNLDRVDPSGIAGPQRRDGQVDQARRDVARAEQVRAEADRRDGADRAGRSDRRTHRREFASDRRRLADHPGGNPLPDEAAQRK